MRSGRRLPCRKSEGGFRRGRQHQRHRSRQMPLEPSAVRMNSSVKRTALSRASCLTYAAKGGKVGKWERRQKTCLNTNGYAFPVRFPTSCGGLRAPPHLELRPRREGQGASWASASGAPGLCVPRRKAGHFPKRSVAPVCSRGQSEMPGRGLRFDKTRCRASLERLRTPLPG